MLSNTRALVVFAHSVGDFNEGVAFQAQPQLQDSGVTRHMVLTGKAAAGCATRVQPGTLRGFIKSSAGGEDREASTWPPHLADIHGDKFEETVRAYVTRLLKGHSEGAFFFVGTPSQTDEPRHIQLMILLHSMARELRERNSEQRIAIDASNGYFYEDLTHLHFRGLKEDSIEVEVTSEGSTSTLHLDTAAWRAALSDVATTKFFVPTSASLEYHAGFLPDADVQVHHPSMQAIDTPFPDTTRTEVRSALGVEEDQRLIFMSGSKSPNEDLRVIAALTYAIKDAPNVVLRIGLHPGCESLAALIGRIIGLLSRLGATEKARVIISDTVATKTHTTADAWRHEPTCCVANVDGDNAMQSSDAVASYYPGTHVAQAAELGRQVMVFDHEPENLFFRSDDLTRVEHVETTAAPADDGAGAERETALKEATEQQLETDISATTDFVRRV